MALIKPKKKSYTVSLVISLGLILNVFLFLIKPSIVVDEKQKNYNPIPYQEKFTFGFRMPMADSLWLRTLQDTSYCESQIGRNICKSNS